MVNRVIFIIAVLLFAMQPALAESPLSPAQVETIPFDSSLANRPNTGAIYDDIHIPEVGDAHHAGGKSGLPQFEVATFASQLFWLAISFFMLYVFFAKKTLPSISSILESRQSTIRNDLERAEKLSYDAEIIKDDYEIAKHDAIMNAQSVLSDAESEMHQQSIAQLNDFKDKSAQEVAKLEQEAAQAIADIKDELDQVIMDATRDIIQSLTDVKITDEDLQEALATTRAVQSNPLERKAA